MPYRKTYKTTRVNKKVRKPITHFGRAYGERKGKGGITGRGGSLGIGLGRKSGKYRKR